MDDEWHTGGACSSGSSCCQNISRLGVCWQQAFECCGRIRRDWLVSRQLQSSCSVTHALLSLLVCINPVLFRCCHAIYLQLSGVLSIDLFNTCPIKTCKAQPSPHLLNQNLQTASILTANNNRSDSAVMQSLFSAQQASKSGRHHLTDLHCC